MKRPRIESVEAVPYALRFRKPYVTARGRLERRELILLRIRAGSEEGLGEAAPLSLRGGADLARIADDLERRCQPVLVGAKLGFPPDHFEPCAATGASSQAVLAVELALFDLYVKQASKPAWKYSDTIKTPRPVPCNATLSMGSPDEVADEAAAWAKRGFRAFKLKVGGDEDIEQVAAVREAVGSDASLRIDANEAWTTEEAIRKLGDLEQFDLELVEQPVAGLEAMAEVRSKVRVPIAADESVNSPDEARQARAMGACDMATVKLAKVGSIRAAYDIAEEVPVYLSSALDGPIGIAAAVNVAQDLPRIGQAATLAQGLATGDLFAETIASTECRVVDGSIAPTELPGWGVEIDEVALAKLRI